MEDERVRDGTRKIRIREFTDHEKLSSKKQKFL